MKPTEPASQPQDDLRDGTERNRRQFLQTAALAATSAFSPALLGVSVADAEKSADAAVKALYDSLSEAQKKAFAFDGDRKGYGKFPLRLHVTNNWAVSNTKVSDLTKDQQGLVEEVLNPIFPG